MRKCCLQGNQRPCPRQAKRQRCSVECRASTHATVFAVAAPERKGASKSAYASDDPPIDVVYDAVIIGSGMGGLSTATQLASAGAKVVVLEK